MHQFGFLRVRVSAGMHVSARVCLCLSVIRTAAGASEIGELRIGIDGIVFRSAKLRYSPREMNRGTYSYFPRSYIRTFLIGSRIECTLLYHAMY